jgi:hypothetical protein
MNLDIFVDNEVTHLTEFYRWWRTSNAGNPQDFPMDLTPEQWGRAMSAYQLDEPVDFCPPTLLRHVSEEDSEILDALFSTEDIVAQAHRGAELDIGKAADRDFLRLVLGGS